MKILLITLFLGISMLGYAQNDTLYYDANWEETSQGYAKFYRPLPLKKNGRVWVIKDYYMYGTLQFIGHTTDENKEVLHGDVIWYFDDGSIQEKVRYREGVIIGNYVALESVKHRSGIGYTEGELHYVKVRVDEAEAKDAIRDTEVIQSGVEVATDADDAPKVYSADNFPLLNTGLSPITFIQEGKTQELLKPYQTIILKKEPFTITFPGLAYDEENEAYNATQIAVVTNNMPLHDINVGMRTEDTTPFGPATGMAMGSNPHYLIIDAEAHNYLYYKDSGDGRLELVQKINEDILQLKYVIDELVLNGTDYSIKDFPLADNSLYLIIFIDKNKNEIIDEGELNKVEIGFE